MPFAQGLVTVSQINATKWELVEPVIYEGNEQTFTVPAGFKTDFASVPRIFFWLIPSYGAYTKAAILHDFLCVTKPISRADADGIFRRAMRELDVPFLRRWIMWAAVRFDSHLKGAKPSEVGIWLFVTVPTVVYLFIPGTIVAIWLFMSWINELIFYVPLKYRSRKRVNRPDFIPGNRL